MRIGRRAGDDVRSRLARLVDKREVDVIDGDDIRSKLELSGFSPDSTYSLADIRALGKYLRVDEYVEAHVAAGPAGPRLWGQIVLMRDQALRQPLPEVSAPKLDSAAALFAKAIAAARAQFVDQRHCENALARRSNRSRARRRTERHRDVSRRHRHAHVPCMGAAPVARAGRGGPRRVARGAGARLAERACAGGRRHRSRFAAPKPGSGRHVAASRRHRHRQPRPRAARVAIRWLPAATPAAPSRSFWRS